jgi:malate synthase
MLVEYLEGWLNGRGAKGIDSLAGKPGIHPALMEDLATARISVAQIAQRIRHRVRCTDSADVHDFPLAKRLLQEETQDIVAHLRGAPADEDNAGAEESYQKACKISLQWVQNYVNLDFRSLGSYTRRQLDEIAGRPDAF